MTTSRHQVGLDQLAGQARAGCRDSLDELARRISPIVLSYLRRRAPTQQDAEDLRQETLLTVVQNLDSYDPGRPFEPWLMTIAARLAAGRARAGRSTELLTDEIAGMEGPIEREASLREAGAILWKTAAGVLPAAQYRALRLRYLDQLDMQGVAAALGVTVANAKVLLFRARRRLVGLPKVQSLLNVVSDAGEDSRAL